jgi:hypothetical protein
VQDGGESFDLYHIPLSVNKIIRSYYDDDLDDDINIDYTNIFMKFKLLYNILPLPIAEEIAYYLDQVIK